MMFMQITTPGTISGLVNLQVFSMGAGGADVRVSVAFDGEGEFAEDGVVQPCGCLDETAFNFDPEALFDDGSCEAVALGCIDPDACNLDPSANTDNGSCLYNDACGCDDLGKFTSVGQTSRRETAIVTATSSTPSACVVAVAWLTWTPTVCVTTWTIVSEPWMRAGCAMVPGPFTLVDVKTCLRAIATVKATSWTPSGCVGVPA